jgi:hypothetical protein
MEVKVVLMELNVLSQPKVLDKPKVLTELQVLKKVETPKQLSLCSFRSIWPTAWFSWMCFKGQQPKL